MELLEQLEKINFDIEMTYIYRIANELNILSHIDNEEDLNKIINGIVEYIKSLPKYLTNIDKETYDELIKIIPIIYTEKNIRKCFKKMTLHYKRPTPHTYISYDFSSCKLDKITKKLLGIKEDY